jgi:phage virion morphogenesis protein
MTTGFQIGLAGLGEAVAAHDGVLDVVQDGFRFWDEVGAALVTSTQFRFDRGQDPDGNPWPPSIRALTEGGRTLTDSARLAQSVTHAADNAGVEVGTDVAYARTHQFGAVIRARNADRLAFRLPGGLGFRRPEEVTIPARPFLGVDEDDETEIHAIWGEILAPHGAERA